MVAVSTEIPRSGVKTHTNSVSDINRDYAFPLSSPTESLGILMLPGAFQNFIYFFLIISFQSQMLSFVKNNNAEHDSRCIMIADADDLVVLDKAIFCQLFHTKYHLKCHHYLAQG